MDNKFLDKVLNQIVRETRIDYDEGRLHTPFYASFPTHRFVDRDQPIFCTTTFRTHCREVYGLNKEETIYVWNEYREIIRDKINNGK